MGPSEQAYNIQQIGVWPYEKYQISPISTAIDPTLGNLLFENNFPYYNNIGNNFKGYIDYDFRTINTSYNLNAYRYQMDLNSGDSFFFSVSTTRKYFDGYVFNKFIIEFDPNSYQKGYVLYPTRLFLKPIAASKTVGGWQIQTSAILLSAMPQFFESFDHNLSGSLINKNYYSNYNNKVELSIIPTSPVSLAYQICASQQFNNKEILRFTDTYNPYQYNINLEETGTKIKPDSTHLYYKHYYYSPLNEFSEISERPVYNLNDAPYTVYILKYFPSVSHDTQTFLMLQSALDFSADFNTIANCVLTAVLDINTTNFKYFAATRQITPGSVVSVISGAPNSFIGAKYITDSVKLKNTKESVYDTVLGYTNAANSNMFGPCSSTQSGFDKVVWDLKYPPHYYNFNLTFKDASYYDRGSQECYITFKLSAHPISLTTDTAILSTYIYSDFQLLKLDLPTYGTYDYIKFEATATIDLLLSSLCCYYGPTNEPYYLSDPQWIPAVSANLFKITYPNLEYGEIRLSVFPKLSTLAGYIEPYFSTDIVLNAGASQLGRNGIPISQTVLFETQDYIETTVSLLTSESSYPTRDLRGSYISWFWQPQDQYTKLCSLSSLSSFYAGQRILFSPETSTVVLSGYGPSTITLSISSEKYNEVSTVSSTSSLFDIFSEKRLVIGSYHGLNNQNFTRNITLTAAVPYKNRIYPLPNNYHIFWYWSYDNNDQNIPVSAFCLGTSYQPTEVSTSNALSSIDFSIQPPQTNLGEVLHNVTVSLYSNIDNINASYIFAVDEFPDSTVLDPNFYTYYRDISSEYIGSTYISTVLTRPLDATAKYRFVLNDDLLNRTAGTTLTWTINDSLLPLSSLSGTSTIAHNITGARITNITLSATNSIAAGWISAHSISKTLTIYSLPSVEFDEPLLFNIYPEFYWISGRNLNISDVYNYTNALSPTAYQNLKSDTYNFWVSANKGKNFDSYRYSVGLPQTSSISLLNIPYDSEFLSIAGLPISLTAYGSEFPESNGLFYKASGADGLYTTNFNITSLSIPFNTTSITNSNRFYRSPKLVPYNTAVFGFSATVTSLNIDTNRYVYVKQNIFSDPIDSPDQPNGGTITYTLSSDYWIATSTIAATDGEFKVFSLLIGDSYVPLNISDKFANTLYLTASANITKTIPETTFDNYPTYPYEKSLWNTVNNTVTSNRVETIVTYTTAGKTNLYISDYYTLTGTDVKIGADPTFFGENNPLSYYVIDCGDDSIEVFNLDQYINHSYTLAGSYNITLSSVYLNGDVRVTDSIKPIVVYGEFPKYDQSEIRFLNETSLTFPYSIDDINIQPNEFGNVDIFNTAISRLEQNLEYIISNSRTINTDTPTDVYGWLGTNDYFKSTGINWHTPDYNSAYYNSPDLAVSSGRNYFGYIQDFSPTSNGLVVLDNNRIRYFNDEKVPKEFTFINYDEFSQNFSSISYMDSNESGDVVFVTDSANNKIHRVELEVSDISYIFDILDIGGFGTKDEPNKFNNPDKIVYRNSYVYVLDYNNHCIKKYTEQLTWVYTYYSDILSNTSIEDFDVHVDTGFVYVITSDQTVHIFDEESTDPFTSMYIGKIIDSWMISDFRFDESGEFFYILSNFSIYKFSSSGVYIGPMNIYGGMKRLKSGPKRTVFASATNYIVKTNDIVDMFGIGEGLSRTGWSSTEISLVSDEFASDVNYNRCLQRLVDNIKIFRDTIDSKFVLASESTSAGTVTYFAKQPVKISERPEFSDDVENNRIGVGINELHIPQVFNREFLKIYEALDVLRAFLDIETVNASTSNGCQSIFCWSWKSMACYNLSLPVIKMCNINPITFSELKSSFGVNYAPTKTWGEAISNCCDSVKNPLM